jgi:hypothetical protein
MFNVVANTIILAILASPLIAIYGWVRWFRCDPQRRPPIAEDMSMFAMALSSVVGLLAIVSSVWASVPDRLTSIGANLSFFGLLLALIGIGRRGPLRWPVLITSLAVLFGWILATSVRSVGPGF